MILSQLFYRRKGALLSFCREGERERSPRANLPESPAGSPAKSRGQYVSSVEQERRSCQTRQRAFGLHQMPMN
jgi:hypothetical protein